jgi:hypothetical protein
MVTFRCPYCLAGTRKVKHSTWCYGYYYYTISFACSKCPLLTSLNNVFEIKAHWRCDGLSVPFTYTFAGIELPYKSTSERDDHAPIRIMSGTDLFVRRGGVGSNLLDSSLSTDASVQKDDTELIQRTRSRDQNACAQSAFGDFAVAPVRRDDTLVTIALRYGCKVCRSSIRYVSHIFTVGMRISIDLLQAPVYWQR